MRPEGFGGGEPPLASFPSDVPIKVFGRNLPGFRESALGCLDGHCPSPAVTEQLSRGGNFVSLTITVRAETRADLDAIYGALCELDSVLMVL